jgi:hypothetical protein
LLILSKFPIAAYEFAEFRAKPLFQTGAIYAKLRISAIEFVHVVVTQLTSGSGSEVRRQQLRKVTELIKRHVKDTLPIFVFGDFAINGRVEEEYKLFDELKIPGFERHDVVCKTLGEHPVTYGAVDEKGLPTDTILTKAEDLKSVRSVDYIFYFKPEKKDWIVESITGAIEQFSVKGRYSQVSSHYGISATFVVTDI